MALILRRRERASGRVGFLGAAGQLRPMRSLVLDGTRRDPGPRILVAETFGARLRGVLGRESLLESAALLIRPCRGIHTFGLRRPIDLAFLAGDGQVLSVHLRVAANRIVMDPRAAAVVEARAGVLRRTIRGPGAFLLVQPG